MSLSKGAISILLVEDHKVTMAGIAACISESADFLIAGKAENSDLAILLAESLKPDIILLDLHLPGAQNLKHVFEKLKACGSRIVVFSAEDRLYLVKLVLSMGASAYLSKGEDFETIMKVLKDVAAGRDGFVSSNLRKTLRYSVTKVEEEILAMLARGMKYEEIAAIRLTSAHTVRKQCDRLQIKLELSSREALIAWAVNKGYGATS